MMAIVSHGQASCELRLASPGAPPEGTRTHSRDPSSCTPQLQRSRALGFCRVGPGASFPLSLGALEKSPTRFLPWDGA